MKRKIENTILATTAFLLASSACVATSRVGLDDGDGGAGLDTGAIIEPPPGPAPVMSYAMATDPTFDLLALEIMDTGVPSESIAIVDADDGNVLRVLRPSLSNGPIGKVAQAGGVIAVGGVSSTSLFRWDGSSLREIATNGAVLSLALSPDGAFLFTGDAYGTIRRYEIATGAEHPSPFAQLPLNDSAIDFVTGLAISPDGTTIAACDPIGVHVWRVSDGALLAEIPSPGGVTLSASGELAVGGGDGQTVTFYDLTGLERGRYNTSGYAIYGVAYSADGTKVAIVNEIPADPTPGRAGFPIVVRIIDRATGTEVAQLFDAQQGRPGPIGAKAVLPVGVAFVADDREVALGWSDRRVTVFSTSSGAPVWSRVLDP